MSQYAAGTGPAIAPGDSQQVWNAETPTPGNGGASASLPVALTNAPGVGGNGISASGFFSAAPGTFEIDLQASDVDVDNQYQTVLNGNITSVDSVNNTWRIDDPYLAAKFARLLMRSRANSVTVTAYIRQR